MTRIINFIRNQSAQDLVEYSLLVALIALGAIASFRGLSSAINSVFDTISSDLGASL